MAEAQFDSEVRKALEDLPVPDMAGQPFVVPKPLGECRVAIVTSAGLHAADVENFEALDQSYRALNPPYDSLVMSQGSQNFDRSGFMQDRNVVFPIDRLRELADQGVIDSVAETNYSFMGAVMEFSTITNDTGPACAKKLLDDGVDVVLLTPV